MNLFGIRIESLLGFGFLLIASLGKVSANKPNVLLIVTDDQRPDTIAALGNEIIDTPNLDRLVKRGTTFEQATCANPLCVPSRAEILSGCSSFRNGVLGMGAERIDPKLTLLPFAMASSGYHAWYVGKWMNDGKPLTRGYQETLGLFSSGGGMGLREGAPEETHRDSHQPPVPSAVYNPHQGPPEGDDDVPNLFNNVVNNERGGRIRARASKWDSLRDELGGQAKTSFGMSLGDPLGNNGAHASRSATEATRGDGETSDDDPPPTTGKAPEPAEELERRGGKKRQRRATP